MSDFTTFEWTRAPQNYSVSKDKVVIETQPATDLWQRTYYLFRNDNAPLLQMKTEEEFFSFTVKTDFLSTHRFDQCGIIMYLDSDNWIKASVEYENEKFQHLGSGVTNNGFSDWSTTEIDASHKTMWYRLSRRKQDFKIECSFDGKDFKQMRICHMFNAQKAIRVGIYACSPENSSFEATFSNPQFTECMWSAHDGQPPDEQI